jgi:spermidine/putrescine transport system permease protein
MRKLKKKKTLGQRLSSWYLVIILLFIYLPIGYVVLFSFNESKSLTNFTGFSFRWYENMFKDRTMLQSIWNTVLVAVVATAVSTVVGTIAAIGLSKAKRVVRSIVLEVNNLPVMNPDIVTAIGLMLLFISVKFQLSLTTLILSHISFCIPYVILTIMPKLRQLDDNVAEAALDLGATPWQALTKVIIPQIYPAILSGALIAFSMSFDDFVISFFTAGVGINNISMYVYSMKRYNPSVNAMSTLIVVVVTLILITVNLIPRIKDKKSQKEEP